MDAYILKLMMETSRECGPKLDYFLVEHDGKLYGLSEDSMAIGVQPTYNRVLVSLDNNTKPKKVLKKYINNFNKFITSIHKFGDFEVFFVTPDGKELPTPMIPDYIPRFIGKDLIPVLSLNFDVDLEKETQFIENIDL